LGNVGWSWLQRRTGLTAQRIICINLAVLALIPAYGLLGLASTRLGYRVWWELYLAVALYGLCLGSLQASSRSFFATMVPVGLESALFAIYTISDRGSTFISPAVFASVMDSTGNLRLTFIYTLVALLLPIAAVAWIDGGAAAAAAHAYAKTHKADAVAMRGGVEELAAEADTSSADGRSAGEGEKVALVGGGRGAAGGDGAAPAGSAAGGVEMVNPMRPPTGGQVV
jgi:MFS transporter, UMF1 family